MIANKKETTGENMQKIAASCEVLSRLTRF